MNEILEHLFELPLTKGDVLFLHKLIGCIRINVGNKDGADVLAIWAHLDKIVVDEFSEGLDVKPTSLTFDEFLELHPLTSDLSKLNDASPVAKKLYDRGYNDGYEDGVNDQ